MPIFLEFLMVASSVTGVGQGDSRGLYKPQNNGSCGCTSPSVPQNPKLPQKKGCYFFYSSNNGSVGHRINSNIRSSKSCF